MSLRADADRSWVAVDTAKGVQVSGTWTQAGGLAAAADGLTHGLDEATEPAMTRLLVCTHGIHDTCCAIRGRPVAATLAARWPELVWECSHLGGDRFAATMVVLPDGACYGGLDDDVAADVVAGHLDGRVMADYLRGISTMPGPMQAAIVHALSRFGPTAIDSVRPVSLVAAGPDVWTATLAGRSQLPVRMVVAVRRSWDAPAQLTCRAERDSAPMRYTATVVEMTQRSR